MKIWQKLSFLLLVCSLSAACGTVTVRPQGGSRTVSSPDYSKRFHFGLGGLIGGAEVDVSKICKDKEVIQMSTEFTFIDGFLSSLTLGLYSPRTANVWCQ